MTKINMISSTNSAKWFTVLCLLFTITIPLFAQNTSQWERLGPFGGPVFNIHRDGHGVLWATGLEGLFRSDNNGHTWQLSVRLKGTGQLAVRDSVIVVSFSDGTLTSSDYGSHWNTFHFNYGVSTPDNIIIKGDTLYITVNFIIVDKSVSLPDSGYPSGILISTDMGKSWDSYALNMQPIDALTSGKNGRLYAVTSGINKILYSDNGTKWDTLNTGQRYNVSSLVTVADTSVFWGNTTGLYRIVGEKPSLDTVKLNVDASHLFAAGDTLFMDSRHSILSWTDNLGRNWHDISYPYLVINDVAVSDGDLWLATDRRGLIRQSAGSEDWTPYNTGLSAVTMSDVSLFAVSPDDSIFAGINTNNYSGILRYEKNGIWSHIGPNSVSIKSVCFSPDGTLFALTSNSLYVRSPIDYTWQTRYIPNVYPGNPKRLSVTENGILYLQYTWLKSTLYMSSDQGVHWKYMYQDNFIDQFITDSTGRLYGIMNKVLVTSADSGSTWTSLAEYSNNLQIESISRRSDNSFLVGTNGNGVFLVTKHGTDWTSMGNPDYILGMIAEDQNRYIFTYSFFNHKAFVWDKDNPGWKTITFPDLSDISGRQGYHGIIIDHHHRVVIWGLDNGIYRSKVNTTILPINRVETEPPLQFALHQNYPNPFNPTTTIRYELAKAGPVKLTVYNMLGQQVSVLVDSRQATGAHQIVFNASRLSSGVYFYRLKAGGNVIVKKMLLIK